MPIDVHAHYVPPATLEALEGKGAEFGVSLVKHPPSCDCSLHFNYGFKTRPFFAKLIEPTDARLKGMDAQGVNRQVLSTWTEISAYGLSVEQGRRWHRFLNQHIAQLVQSHPRRFALLASVPLQDAQAAAAELEYGVRELGAVGAVVGANVEGKNLGDVDLDAFWQKAVELDVGVFVHPVASSPVPRTEKFGMAQTVHYTYDTTLTVGSLILNGVLDRFPALRLLLSHGGGTFPYLAGRFDLMYGRMKAGGQGSPAQARPSDYLKRFFYDTILHEPTILHWLSTRVSVDRIVLGSDYSFPPEDRDPVGSVRSAGFSAGEVRKVIEDNPRALFPRLRD
jgi:aminocarboxymuconate-semialdehyde decarboxylase